MVQQSVFPVQRFPINRSTEEIRAFLCNRRPGRIGLLQLCSAPRPRKTPIRLLHSIGASPKANCCNR